MKKTTRILSMFCLFALIATCVPELAEASNKITGEFISIQPEGDDETAPIEPADLSMATLTISYASTDENGEMETSTLYQGAYHEDFATSIQLKEPTEVTISLQEAEDSVPLTINAVLGNDSDVHFAYVDRPGPQDEFLLVGSSNQVVNPKNKFSVSGDLSFLDIDLTNTTTVFLWANFVNADGERQLKHWGPVLVNDDLFLIEGDIDRPIQARLFVSAGRTYNTSTQLLLEPKGDFKVAKIGNQTQAISVTSETGYHAILIDSWQRNKEYIALLDEYVIEYERFHNPTKNADATSKPDGKGEEDASDEIADVEEEKTDEDSKNAMVKESVDLAEGITPAEGCEDAVIQEFSTEVGEQDTPTAPPRWIVLREEIAKFQTNKLQDIAKNHKDPSAQLLAMEMGAFSPYENAEEALEVWRTLADKFDEDIVASKINPELERTELIHTRSVNDELLVPGQKIPGFTLANLDGEDIAIYDLLGEKRLVLIDFWASWCGPCIAAFPELKKLHAAYTDENFEIVGVSIDNNLEDWSGGVEDHSLPWVQLGELKDGDNGSSVALSYGVNFIPKTFLVDSQGCIYRKNIHPNELKTFLVDRYGLDESLEEPEVETDDSPDVSS